MAARMTKRTDGRFTATARIDAKRVFAYGTTQTEAKRKLAELVRKAEQGQPVRESTRPLGDWLEEWCDTFLASSDRARATRTLYAQLLRSHVVPVLGTVALDKLRPSDVVRLFQALEGTELSASTRRSIYAALRAAPEDAVANKLLADNPAAAVKRPRAERTEARHLTPAEVARLVAVTDGMPHGDVLRFILLTGLRRGEALGLRWSDVDLVRGEAKIRESKSAAGRRTVALSPSAVELLRARGRGVGDGLLFTSQAGTPIDPRNLLRLVKLGAKKAGIDPTGLGVHSLRHSFASSALLAGAPILAVSRSLGHSSISITLDTYGHVDSAAAADVAARVAAAMGL